MKAHFEPALRSRRQQRRARWHAVLALGAALVGAGARAQELERAGQGAPAGEEANREVRRHFERGVGLYEDGDYGAALLEFRRAYALNPDYRLLYNLGQVADELHDYAAAEDYFRRYLDEGGAAISPERKAEVDAELTRLSSRVGTLRIEINRSGAQLRVDGRRVEHSEAEPVRVNTGRHLVSAELPGLAPVSREVEVLGGETQTVSLVFGAEAKAERGAANTRSAGSPAGVLPWITGIGSAALLAGAGAITYSAYQDSADYDSQLNRFTTQRELERISDRVRTKALIADVMFASAIAGTVATIVLIVIGENSTEPKPRSDVAFGPAGAELRF